MKKFLSYFFTFTLLSFAQEEASKKSNEATDQPEKPQFVIEIEALTQEQKKDYFTYYHEAERFFQQRRIFECLESIHALHKIYDKNPASLNLQGACYVEFRDFKKARKTFNKALSITPGNFNINFNLAEIDFVSGEFKSALGKLQNLKKDIEGNARFRTVIPLVDFKILLCHLKANNEKEARKILEEVDFLDDSPLFYFGNAALDYYADRGSEAETWLARAKRIFQDDDILPSWQDTLIEFGYIKSFYGGDLEVDIPSPTGE